MNIYRAPTMKDACGVFPYDLACAVTEDKTNDYNCLGFCLGVRAWVSEYKPNNPDGPRSMAQALFALGFVRGSLAPGQKGTQIVLHSIPNWPRPNYDHVIKYIGDDLYESKFGAGPRLVHKRQLFGADGEDWFLESSKREAANARLRAFTHAGYPGCTMYSPFADGRPLGEFATVRDTYDQHGRIEIGLSRADEASRP